MSVLDRIATAIRAAIDREPPAGDREPRQPKPTAPTEAMSR